MANIRRKLLRECSLERMVVVSLSSPREAQPDCQRPCNPPKGDWLKCFCFLFASADNN